MTRNARSERTSASVAQAFHLLWTQIFCHLRFSGSTHQDLVSSDAELFAPRSAIESLMYNRNFSIQVKARFIGNATMGGRAPQLIEEKTGYYRRKL